MKREAEYRRTTKPTCRFGSDRRGVLQLEPVVPEADLTSND
ncbi:MAG: hypothetical protein VX738_11530 [Planctomycetota bacterium]|nr:hypothetical protein [Planctomycetota bacterium]